MACSVCIHRVKQTTYKRGFGRNAKTEKKIGIKTNACGCKTHKVLLVHVVEHSRSGEKYATRQLELCKVHAEALKRKGKDFFNEPEFVNQTNDPNAVQNLRKNRGYLNVFRNWWRLGVDSWELIDPLTVETPTKRAKRREDLKGRLKRLMGQSNMKILTEGDWFEALEEAIKEHAVESVMKS